MLFHTCLFWLNPRSTHFVAPWQITECCIRKSKKPLYCACTFRHILIGAVLVSSQSFYINNPLQLY